MADTDTRTDGREKLKSPNQLVPGGGQPARAQLVTDSGKTLIAEGVVAKISGFAAKEIPGVHSMGTGMARRVGQLRNLVPGGNEASTQGVSVEVGEREAAVDLDIVTWYGQSIVDISDAVRRNVIDRVQAMTGLRVIEVNINVDDVFVDGEQNSGMSGSGGNNAGMRSR
ncbi:Asp23/Gls24 family envelope stress response protein [Micromonospora sp. NPDC050417]|uniref:Asp23/Gls24 family envelope stress response protein n=1 Tax=Micromonospora sp. NPDC050417 TaxID=3364280 RepID=UPI0037B2D11F